MTSGPYGLQPFDLEAPLRVLLPNLHRRRGLVQQSAGLGDSDDKATLTVTRWDGCQLSCPAPEPHEAGYSVRLAVPCENRPHCSRCECDSDHSFYLDEEKIAALKEILP